MNYSEVLQKYLLRFARGELKDTTTILPLLKTAKVFLPQTKNIDFKNLVKVTFPVINKNNQKLIPIYLSRSNSTTYSGTLTNLKTQILDPIEMKGGSLLEILPADFGIIVEPSSSLEVIFDYITLKNFEESSKITHSYKESKNSPNISRKEKTDRVDTISRKYSDLENRSWQKKPESQVANEILENEKPISQDNSFSSDNLINKQIEPIFDEREEISSNSINLHVITGGKDLPEEASEEMLDEFSEKIKSRFDISNLEEELRSLFPSFQRIEEAYLLEHSSPHSELVLGLLIKDWIEDERFRIIESIAMISKQIFGYAGAIEVYDDLYDSHSNSWDLFKMISPFYVNEKISTSLAEKIEVLSEKNRKGIRGSMSKLTKTGLRFLSGLQSK